MTRLPANLKKRRLGGKGGTVLPVGLGDQKFHALLDTGASYSMLSAATAKAWGVTPLIGTVNVSGIGGMTFSARPGVIPELRIGAAVLHNAVVMIAPDKEAIVKSLLGYPVISALGKLSFHKDRSLTIGARSNGVAEAAQLWIGDQSLLIWLKTAAVADGGKPARGSALRLFMLETGSYSTFLTDKYLLEHRSEFPAQPDSLPFFRRRWNSHNPSVHSIASPLMVWLDTGFPERATHTGGNARGRTTELFRVDWAGPFGYFFELHHRLGADEVQCHEMRTNRGGLKKLMVCKVPR